MDGLAPCVFSVAKFLLAEETSQHNERQPPPYCIYCQTAYVSQCTSWLAERHRAPHCDALQHMICWKLSCTCNVALWIKVTWKCSLQNGSHFVSASFNVYLIKKQQDINHTMQAGPHILLLSARHAVSLNSHQKPPSSDHDSRHRNQDSTGWFIGYLFTLGAVWIDTS